MDKVAVVLSSGLTQGGLIAPNEHSHKEEALPLYQYLSVKSVT